MRPFHFHCAANNALNRYNGKIINDTRRSRWHIDRTLIVETSNFSFALPFPRRNTNVLLRATLQWIPELKYFTRRRKSWAQVKKIDPQLQSYNSLNIILIHGRLLYRNASTDFYRRWLNKYASHKRMQWIPTAKLIPAFDISTWRFQWIKINIVAPTKCRAQITIVLFPFCFDIRIHADLLQRIKQCIILNECH